uniref:SH2 domain-containing protein n=1 Tax=Biomphalaria glabrata TaxID=6526 RepID=A0A2C9L825_BIOGL
MSSESKSDFVRSYKYQDYSGAVPTKAFFEKSASLGEYCEPVDSRRAKKIVEEGYNSDPDHRYAQPQDAVKKVKSQMPEELGTVYNLAKVPDDSEGTTPTKKPSPKPRSARNKYIGQGDTQPLRSDEDKTQPSHLENVMKKDNKVKLATSRDPLKRPGKKVVEIEYEVAKTISASPVDARQTKPPSDNHSSITSNSMKLQTSALSPVKIASSSASTQGTGKDFVYSVSKSFSPPVGAEATYEEPWDLKMKRLKQEQERGSKDPCKPTEKSPGIKRGESLFEDAIESFPQNVLENRPSYLRTVSQTSEIDVFHDALDTVQGQKFQKENETPASAKRLPNNTYEDAWDLKNSLLEQRIRQMQIQATAAYEEPWDASKQHQLLQAKLQEEEKKVEQERSPRHKSITDVCDSPLDGGNSESKTIIARGKYHSMDESKIKSKGRGCNVGQQINPLIPLANQNWYHGNISRDDAEKMLRVCKDGSYIVRVSSDRKSFSLSIKSPKQYIHVQIEQVVAEDGSICYILGKNSKTFHTIPEMIDYYTNHRVPLKGTEHITLLHPVECKWS